MPEDSDVETYAEQLYAKVRDAVQEESIRDASRQGQAAAGLIPVPYIVTWGELHPEGKLLWLAQARLLLEQAEVHDALSGSSV